jgi:hypothetical protein
MSRQALDQLPLCGCSFGRVAAHKNGKAFLSLHHEAKAGYDYCDGCSLRRGVFHKSGCESCITDDVTKSGYARVNCMYPESEEMSAHSTMLFDHSITDGQAMMCSV